MKIYVVTDGEYSDYHVIGAFSTQEKAEYAQMLYMTRNHIMTLEVDDIPDHIPGHTPWSVLMDKDGNATRTERIALDCMFHKWNPQFEYFDTKDMTPDVFVFTGLQFPVWAVDAEHAVKIAADVRCQVLAEAAMINLDWNNRSAVEDYWRKFNKLRPIVREPSSWDKLVEMKDKLNENA